MQTSAEVIDALLRNRPAERAGVQELFWPDAIRAWRDAGHVPDVDGEPDPPERHFALDMSKIDAGFRWQANLDAADEIIDQTDEWKIVRDGNGAALKWWKDKSGTPEHVDFRMASREVWEADYRPHLTGDPCARVDLDTPRRLLAPRAEAGFWTYCGQRFVWECMRAAMGDVALYENMLLDPDWIHDYCRVYTDLWKQCFSILFAEVGRPHGVWVYEDLGYKQRLFCSPELYRKLIFPYYAELVEFFHSHDLPVILHSCGYVHPAMDLIVDAGFDALNPMEVKAGNDPLALAEQYGDRIAFVGGLDVRVLESGDRELIRREVAALVSGMIARGTRYVFSSDHSISTAVEYDDYRLALDVYREHMNY